jgi:hypothetical protein
MTAVVRHILRTLSATNEDFFFILMLIVVGLLLSICLTLTLGPAPPVG